MRFVLNSIKSSLNSRLIDSYVYGRSRISRRLIHLAHVGGSNSLKVIITGSPRAGTSFLAGLVHKMGFNLGPNFWLNQSDKHNPHGYYECIPLIRISNEILDKLDADFHHNLPNLKGNWTDNFREEKREIREIVKSGGLEMYKGNRLLVLADLYDEIFPEAKWLFIERDIRATYRSRFGEVLTFSDWKSITENRLSIWHSTRPSDKALYLSYKDFKTDLRGTISKIIEFLEVTLSDSQLEDCINFFQPSH